MRWPKRWSAGGLVGLALCAALPMPMSLAATRVAAEAATVDDPRRARAPRAAGRPSPGRVGGRPRHVNLRMATFNIQKLGPRKASRPEVMAKLARIIRGYDLVAVQEIQDRTQRVPHLLLEAVNGPASGPEGRSERPRGSTFAMVLSPRSGQQPDDRRSQEQYAYYYRVDRLVPDSRHRLFDDSAHDFFQREPHVARFVVQDACTSVVLMNVHTRPRAAISEIAAVEHVFTWARARYGGAEHFVALGDFNAGCGYASEEDLDALPIHGAHYDWVIPHSADSNLADAQCPYDRIVVHSSRGNLFVEDWGVERAFTDRRVSDHWPVWAVFQFRVPPDCTPAGLQ